jgi:hypothetical protein
MGTDAIFRTTSLDAGDTIGPLDPAYFHDDFRQITTMEFGPGPSLAWRLTARAEIAAEFERRSEMATFRALAGPGAPVDKFRELAEKDAAHHSATEILPATTMLGGAEEPASAPLGVVRIVGVDLAREGSDQTAYVHYWGNELRAVTFDDIAGVVDPTREGSDETVRGCGPDCELCRNRGMRFAASAEL